MDYPDVVLGDLGMSMEDYEAMITAHEAKIKEQEAELVKLRKPSIFSRMKRLILSRDLICFILVLAGFLGLIGGVGCLAYYVDEVKPNRLANEAFQKPALTDEELIEYMNYKIGVAWDDKNVLQFYHPGNSRKYIHLSEEDYKLVKNMDRLDLVQLQNLREMKRKLREAATPAQTAPTKDRPEY